MAKQTALRYGDWELSRAEQVAAASQGRIGYLHLRAMGPNDIASFARDFYANINREGLIIDVRRNNGGNIDSWIIEKLLRKAWAYWAPPGVQPSSNMQNTFRATWWCWSMNSRIPMARPLPPASRPWAWRRWWASARPAPASGSATIRAWLITAWRAWRKTASSASMASG